MGLFLTCGFYFATLAFWGGILSRLLVLWKTYRLYRAVPLPGGKSSPGTQIKTLCKTLGDIFFLSRLLRTNDVLWLGEWMFHGSFILVVLRHLRFFLNPVPEWIVLLQPAGAIAGYILPVALIYILVVKLIVEKGYFSTYNFFLLSVIFSASLTGILMRTLFRIDSIAAKVFILGLLGFRPQAAPGESLFAAHFILILVLLLYLPSHLFTAPFTLLDARAREEKLKRMLHTGTIQIR